MWQARNKIVNKGGIVIAVLHDINMAYQFADRIIILKEGNLVVDDNTQNGLDPEILSGIFNIEVKKITTDENEVFFTTKPAVHFSPSGNNANFEHIYPETDQNGKIK